MILAVNIKIILAVNGRIILALNRITILAVNGNMILAVNDTGSAVNHSLNWVNYSMRDRFILLCLQEI